VGFSALEASGAVGLDVLRASWGGSIPVPGSPEPPASDPDAFKHPAQPWHRREIPTPNGKHGLEAKGAEIPSGAGSATGQTSSPTSPPSPTASHHAPGHPTKPSRPLPRTQEG